MKRLLAFTAGFMICAGTLLAQNTTAATAANVPWGQSFLSSVGNGTQLWYSFHVELNRSYCVEVGQPNEGTYGDKFLDTVLTIYRSDGTTVILQNDDTPSEPFNYFLSRACFIPPVGNTDDFAQLTNLLTNSSSVRIRFIETTLFCPWFFIAGDYNAFSLIRNTSSTPLNGVVVTWNGLNGAQAGQTTVSIPADGTIILNARDFVNPATFSNGSVSIAHTGSLQQLIGSTTTLSGTTGLGFDAEFTQRQPW